MIETDIESIDIDEREDYELALIIENYQEDDKEDD